MSSTDVPGVAFSVVSASHVCTGNIGALIAKAMKKPRKSQRWVVGSISIALSSVRRYVGLPARADTTYRPMTEPSMIRPPASW